MTRLAALRGDLLTLLRGAVRSAVSAYGHISARTRCLPVSEVSGICVGVRHRDIGKLPFLGRSCVDVSFSRGVMFYAASLR